MSAFDNQSICSCNHPDCYFCWLNNQSYYTTTEKTMTSKKHQFTSIDIFTKICNVANVDKEQVKSRSRKHEIVIVRQIFCYLARELTKDTDKEIGNVIERDHSSVVYSCKMVKNAFETRYCQMTQLYDKLKNALYE